MNFGATVYGAVFEEVDLFNGIKYKNILLNF